MVLTCVRDLGWILARVCEQKCCQALEQTAERSGGEGFKGHAEVVLGEMV